MAESKHIFFVWMSGICFANSWKAIRKFTELYHLASEERRIRADPCEGKRSGESPRTFIY